MVKIIVFQKIERQGFKNVVQRRPTFKGKIIILQQFSEVMLCHVVISMMVGNTSQGSVMGKAMRPVEPDILLQRRLGTKADQAAAPEISGIARAERPANNCVRRFRGNQPK